MVGSVFVLYESVTAYSSIDIKKWRSATCSVSLKFHFPKVPVVAPSNLIAHIASGTPHSKRAQNCLKFNTKLLVKLVNHLTLWYISLTGCCVHDPHNQLCY